MEVIQLRFGNFKRSLIFRRRKEQVLFSYFFFGDGGTSGVGVCGQILFLFGLNKKLKLKINIQHKLKKNICHILGV